MIYQRKFMLVIHCMLSMCYVCNAYSSIKSDHFEYDKRSTVEYSTPRGKRSVFNTKNIFMLEVLRQSSAYGIFALNTRGKFEFLKDQYPIPKIQKAYDIIIVGAGPAGCVLANRLTESGKWTVLLLDAGDAENIMTRIPMMAGISESTEHAWRYPAEKNPKAYLAMNNQTSYFAIGKGLGGGTLINYMVYSRGTRRDYDKIAEAGNYGWSYDEVLPYFIKSENSELRGLENSQHHGKNGPLSVVFLTERTKYSEAFLEGAKELKQNIGDYNNGQPGFGYVQANIQKGQRHSAARAFLFPIRDRRNLHILQNSRVTKIHINKLTKRATSLEYVRNRQRYKVRARKEIILSAGAHNSPKLLMLSGVGPKDHLKELDIPVIQDLKVGETIYDHVAFPGLTFMVDEPDGSEIGESIRLGASIFQWLADGTGPMSTLIGLEAVGFINTNISTDHENSSDIEILLLTQQYANIVISALMDLRPDIYNEYYLPIKDKRAILMDPVLLTTRSKGYMKLKDKNPFHYPKFYKNLYSDERDLDTLVAGIRFIIKLSETEAFQKYGTRLYKAHFPPCKKFVFGSNDYWKCTIQNMGIDFRHMVGTCKMGPDSDVDAVVDPELRVKGVKGLRVVDAGVFPFPLSGHTTAPVYMLAERASDLIKNTWKYSTA